MLKSALKTAFIHFPILSCLRKGPSQIVPSFPSKHEELAQTQDPLRCCSPRHILPFPLKAQKQKSSWNGDADGDDSADADGCCGED